MYIVVNFSVKTFGSFSSFISFGLKYIIFTGNNQQQKNVRLWGKQNVDGIGFVQVLKARQWGFICDDHWNQLNAQVVCQELCYNQ